jgi:hypothetical protein
VATGFEDDRLGRLGHIGVLQVPVEELQLDVPAVELGRLRAEIDSPQVIAVLPRPAAVHPGADHERVLDTGVLPLDVVSNEPYRSSASYQPVTVITAGATFFRCGRMFRRLQKSS